LSDTYRVLAWDAPGAGQSSDPAEGASLDDWADWLAEFVRSLDLAPVHIAGLSWGGGLALAFTQRHPSLVRSLVLMSAYAGWGGSLSEDEVRRRLELSVANSQRPPEEWVPGMLQTLLPPGSEEGLADELTTMLTESHPAATRVALTAFAGADLRPGLGEIEVPTLMIYGDLDVRAPREVWEPIHAAIPHSTLVLIPETGHMVDMQAPDRCNAEIRAFLDSIERRSPSR
jgi:pimeloyl-ACP methyl ester carboxylesterase